MELETGETVAWRGRPAYHLRYIIATLIFFLGIFVINLGPIGQAVGVTSFFLMILFLIITPVSLVLDARSKYFVTNIRILARKDSLSVQDLSGVRSEQNWLGRLRGTGKVYFDSKDGRWLAFKHVKDPEQIKQSATNLRGTIPASTAVSTIFCNYCGARVALGITKCPNCGGQI